MQNFRKLTTQKYSLFKYFVEYLDLYVKYFLSKQIESKRFI